jgi:hypothetical protein
VTLIKKRQLTENTKLVKLAGFKAEEIGATNGAAKGFKISNKNNKLLNFLL